LRAPAIVAHEAASIHLISGGRFELGIGAGWYQPKLFRLCMRVNIGRDGECDDE
jgi:alkanesulfonate monooxygenase SsuD/methylene tetrahydromethanopterin reductase-like flavin-dependent oxidoreductase (luciferase family)